MANMTTQQNGGSTQLSVKSLFGKDEVKKKFQEMLGKKAQGFISSVLQIVAQNQLLANADPNTVLQSAAMAATLDLPLNNNLGFAYIIPYNQNFKDEKGVWQSRQVAQFQIGYKGFIQLAQRSGLFKTLSSTPVLDGQITQNNPLTGFEFDFTTKNNDKVIGYAAYFKLINGFEKTLYMTVEDIKKHGGKYSKSFKTANGLWNTDFDAMATKTVLKLLISKFAPMTIDIQKAVVTDQALINNAETEDITYIDNDAEIAPINKENERVMLMIGDCTTVDELKSIEPNVPDDLLDLFNNKMDTLKEAKK